MAESEALPEADREYPAPHPAEAERVFGHDDTQKAFTQALLGHRLHNVWLLGGEKGIGKASLAYHLARQLLALGLNEDEKTQSNHLVATRQHSRLYRLIRPWGKGDKSAKTSIPIDSVRALSHHLHHRAGAESWRVVIIDSVDELNLNAANALLKVLEEPPERVVFFLINHQAGRVLPTLRSRAQLASLHPLSNELMAAWFSSYASNQKLPPCDEALIKAAEGVPLTLLSLADQGAGLRHKFHDLIALIHRGELKGGDKVLQSFVDPFVQRGADKDRASLWFFIDQEIRQKARHLAQAGSLARAAYLADLSTQWRQASQQAETYNIDQKQLLMGALLTLGAI